MEAKLMTLLFYNGAFNRENRRMRATLVREVSNGTNTYRVWRDAGAPDIEYPRNEQDRYILYVELNGRIFPLGVTEFNLIDQCAAKQVMDELYGGYGQRGKYFDELRGGPYGPCPAVDAALEKEEAMIQELGSRQERWADYIQNEIEKHVRQYEDCRDRGGRFPDFVGALALGELDRCCELRDIRNEEERQRRIEREREDAEAEKQRRERVNDEAKRQVEVAMHTLRHGGVITNDSVEMYERDGRHIERSIILHLLKVNDIDVPLRTQGWINERLASVTVRDGKCVSARYMKSKGGRGSEKMFECVDELIQKVKES